MAYIPETDFARAAEPYTLEEVLAVIAADKARGATPPPAPTGTGQDAFYRGAKGTPEYFTFSNIPEYAQERGLQKWTLPPPAASVGGAEMYGRAPVDISALMPSPSGLERGYAEYVREKGAEAKPRPEYEAAYQTSLAGIQAAKQPANYNPQTFEEAQAEMNRMWAVGRDKGYADKDILTDIRKRGLDKIKPEYEKLGPGDVLLKDGKPVYTAPAKAEKAFIPRFGVSVEAAARAMGYESFADVPTGEEANKVMEEARRQQALGVSTKEEAKAGFRQPSSAERTVMSDIETSINMLDSLDKMYKPEYTGPIAGRVGGVQSVTGIGLSPGEASFRAATSTFRNQVIKAITGAQMSEPEAQRIRKQIPEENDPPEVWRAKRQEATKLLQETLAIKKDILARGGYILGEARGETQPGAAATGGGIKTIASDADYDALPSGASYIDPTGKQRRKQ